MKEIEFDRTSLEKEESGTEKKGKPISKVPTVRTFRNDVQDLMKDKTVSRSSVAMAEAARREARGESRFPVTEEETHLGRMIFILFLVLAFAIGVGAYALIGTRFSISGQNATSTPKEITSSEVSISLSNSPREQILADISIAFAKTVLPTGGSRSLLFLVTDENGKNKSASLSEFLAATEQDEVPDNLLSSLSNNFTFQVFSNSTLAGVVTTETRSYPDSFAAMLEWEPVMAKTLIPIMNPWYDRKRVSTLYGREFKDVRIGAYDARILYDPDGVPLLAYAFTDKKTLFIAGGKDTLEEVLDKNIKK